MGIFHYIVSLFFESMRANYFGYSWHTISQIESIPPFSSRKAHLTTKQPKPHSQLRLKGQFGYLQYPPTHKKARDPSGQRALSTSLTYQPVFSFSALPMSAGLQTVVTL